MLYHIVTSVLTTVVVTRKLGNLTLRAYICVCVQFIAMT